jgi:hypothetical protein
MPGDGKGLRAALIREAPSVGGKGKGKKNAAAEFPLRRLITVLQ